MAMSEISMLIIITYEIKSFVHELPRGVLVELACPNTREL